MKLSHISWWKDKERKNESVQVKPNETPHFCHCIGSHRITSKAFIERADLTTGFYTMFMVFYCTVCKNWGGIPETNFMDTLKEGDEETLSLMKSKGVPVDLLRESLGVKVAFCPSSRSGYRKEVNKK